MSKLLIIGIDGADHEYLSAQFERGRLPALRTLAGEGAFGPLRSTCPPVSCPAWVTMTTGRSPGDLGLFDFTLPDGYGKRLVCDADVGELRLWDYAGANGARSLVFNVPVTYPPRPISGVMVSGFLSPSGSQFSSPPEVGEELRQRFGYAPGHAATKKQQMQAVRQRRDAFLHLLRRDGWDVAMVVFGATDWAQHNHWEDRGFIDRLFSEVDEAVAAIVEEADPDNVLVLSDHGFTGADGILNVNRLLAEGGLLTYGDEGSDPYAPTGAMVGRDGETSRLAVVIGKVFRPRPILNALHFLHLEWLLNLVPSGLWRRIKRSLPVWSTSIDWEHTKAYLYNGNPQTVSLNLRGREPAGTVPEDEYEEVLAEVLQVLEEARDPTDGRPICRSVQTREEAFGGRHVDRAPDLIFEVTDDRYIVSPADHPRVVWQTGRTRGRHRYSGIYITRGSAFSRQDGPEVQLVQMLPTLLHVLGMPVPSDMAPNVAQELLKDRGQPVQTQDYHIPVHDHEAGQEAGQSDEVRDRLRDLGYL
ncbi:MAG: alkaline phosphatase family protein [Candidatus Brocadiia bacterium]